MSTSTCCSVWNVCGSHSTGVEKVWNRLHKIPQKTGGRVTFDRIYPFTMKQQRITMNNSRTVHESYRFNTIYKQYHQRVKRLIRRTIKDEMLCEELCNDAFIRVHKNLATFDESKACMMTWIGTIAKNLVVDHLRKKRPDISYINHLINDSNEGEDSGALDRLRYMKDEISNPEELLRQKELFTLMCNEFEKLQLPAKKIANLYFFEGLSYEEICKELSLPLGTVKAKLHFARKSMLGVVPADLRNEY